MDKDKFIELATKYLSNEATFEEKEQLSEFLKDEKYNEMFVWLSENWQNFSPKKSTHDFNIERGLHKLTKKITLFEPDFTWEDKEYVGFHRRNSLLKIAAIVAIFIFIGIFGLYHSNRNIQENKQITFNVKKTLPGQKSIITLFDGTKVILNADSKLKYPSRFNDSLRQVFLEGEAYFEVKHNPQKPFVVHSGELSTKVLGTKFNVSAFPVDNNIKVSLVEGKVVVSGEKFFNNSHEVQLSPHQQFVYNVKSKKGKVRRFNLIKEIGWKDNRYIFDNESLSSALMKLGRAFGVKFELKIPDNRQYKIKANFNNESFWTIIEAIKYATKLNYKIVSKDNKIEKVIFSRAK